MIRGFAAAIRDVSDYIPGPDMGTDEQCMAWVKDEPGRAVGLPDVLGGIPLDEIGATGFGLAASTEIAREFIGLDLKGARIALQGLSASTRLFFGREGRRACCCERHQRHIGRRSRPQYRQADRVETGRSLAA